MPSITKRLVDATRPAAERVYVWDDELRGFGLLVLPSGVKSFVLQYRTEAGRSRRMTLGRYGALTPDQARRLAKERLHEVAQGHDPAEDRRELRAAPTVNDLLDRYLSEHVDVHNAETTRREVRRLVDKKIRPALGTLKVAAVTRADVARFHHAEGAAPRSANFCLSILSKAFALAELWRLRPEYSNPARRIERYEEATRERFLSEAELTRLGGALVEAETLGLPWSIGTERSKHAPKAAELRAPASPMAVAALRLLLFTGARRSEILQTRWADVDLAAGTVALPDRKGGARRPHPVSLPVLEIIKGLNKPKGAVYLFPRPSDPKLPMAVEQIESAWQRIRKRAQLEDVRLHDLRHTVGTFASEAGSNAFMIAHLLRHANITITQRYVNPNAEPIRAVSEVVAQRLSAGLAGESRRRPVAAGRRSRARPAS